MQLFTPPARLAPPTCQIFFVALSWPSSFAGCVYLYTFGGPTVLTFVFCTEQGLSSPG